MRVVLDTNVLVSASFWRGPSFTATEFAISGRIISITSIEILKEYSGILKRDFKLSEEDIQKRVGCIALFSELTGLSNPINAIKADPKDNKIIEAAVEGNADFIVSGDRHLLELKKFRNINIITPRTLVEILEER